MRHDADELHLRDAFAPEPGACHEALMRAAGSVKEDIKMKRISLRAIPLAAIVLILLTAAALAAGHFMGWTDFFRGSDVGVPRAAVEQMQPGQELCWEVGPLTFTVNELITDGHILMSGTHVTTTDGSAALLTTEPFEAVGALGETGRALAARLGVEPSATWLEAARQTGLPLYAVRALPEHPLNEGGMEDPLWNEDGSITCFGMLFLQEPQAAETPDGLGFLQDAAPAELEAGFYLRCAEIDPATGEEMQRWIDTGRTVTLKVSGLVEERVYRPDGQAVLGGWRLSAVYARRYATGAYMYLVLDAGDGAQQDAAGELYEVRLLDESGQPLPGGMDLSTWLDDSAWPRVVLRELCGVEELPGSMVVAFGEELVVVR